MEKEFRKKEEALLEDSVPKDKNDFEKLLLEHPNSSYVWIQYMAYYLKLSEIEQARSVADRALQRIDPTYQDEKFNIWVALMNLENTFGTEKTLNDVFSKAIQYSDKKKIYLAAIKMYQRSNNHNMVEELYKTLTKKFSTHKSVWIRNAMYYYKQNKQEEARKLFSRCLKSLPRRKHINVITKFSEQEFKLGTVERGRSIFEDLLRTYPNRIEIWNLYLDQEMRIGDVEKIRNLLDRVASINLSTKKMKYFLQRYLAFEEKNWRSG